MDVNDDRLSYLPEDLIVLIISFLPIKNAVATSILSTSWRYKWVNIQELLFDKDTIPIEDSDELVKAISNVLMCHAGPIRSFVLYHERLSPVAPLIDNWISRLSASPHHLLVLYLVAGTEWENPYRIPSSLFNCRDLVHLELWDCAIELLPSTFTGFKLLKQLKLHEIKSSDAVINNMISSSPLLEKLTLRDLVGVSRLSICAPRLWLLRLTSPDLEDVTIGANCLKWVFLKLTRKVTQDHAVMNMCNFFHPIKNATTFWCRGLLLRYLSIGPVPQRLRSPCLELKVLVTDLDIKSSKEISAFLCLLRSCPNLTDLSIHLRRTYTFWEENHPPCPLPRLKHLVVVKVSAGSKGEMGLIKFLLLNAPSLELLVSFAENSVGCPELLKELMQFKRLEVFTYQLSDFDSVIEIKWGGISLKRK